MLRKIIFISAFLIIPTIVLAQDSAIDSVTNLFKKYISKPNLICEGKRYKDIEDTISWSDSENFLIKIYDYLNKDGINFGVYEHRSFRKDGFAYTPNTGDFYWDFEDTSYGKIYSFKIPEFNEDVNNRIYSEYEYKLVGNIKLYDVDNSARLHLGRGNLDSIEVSTYNTTKLKCTESDGES